MQHAPTSELGAKTAPIAFGAGCASYFFLPLEPAHGVMLGAFASAAVCGVAWLVSARRPERRFATGARVVCGALALLAAGFAIAGAEARRVYAPQLARMLPEQELQGRVVWSEPRPTGSSILLAITHTSDYALLDIERVQLWAARDLGASLRAGCDVRLRARLVPLTKAAAPRAHDFRFVSYYRRIGANGFVDELQSTDCTLPLSLAERVARLRQGVGARIDAVLPMPSSAIAVALLTGARGRIDAASKDAFRDSGLAHMLAISGLHMVLMAGSFYALLRLLFALLPRLTQRHDMRRASAAGALAVASLYLVLAGASVATQRAFIMIGLIFLAIMARRRALTMRNVALAALVVMLLHPHTMMLASFQMSFAAVIALVAFYEWVGPRAMLPAPRRRSRLFYVLRRFWTYGYGLVMTSLVAGAATGFLAAWHFQKFATLGLLANVGAMPLLGMLVMPAGVVALLAMPFGWEAAPLKVMSWGIEQMLAVAAWVAALPRAVVQIGPSEAYVLVLACAGFLFLCLWTGRWRVVGLVPLALAMALLGRAPLSDGYVLGGAWQIALRQGDGRLAVSPRGGRQYEARAWLRHENDRRSLADAQLQCGAANGVAAADLCELAAANPNWRIGWAKTPTGVAAACQTSARYDLVVTRHPVPLGCAAEQFLDDRSLRRHHMRALQFVPKPNGAHGFVLRHQATHRASRFWTGDGVR